MGLVAEMAVVCALALHRRGVGIGFAEEEVCLTPVPATLRLAVLTPRLGDPVALGGVGGGEVRVFGGRKQAESIRGDAQGAVLILRVLLVFLE